MGKELAEPAAPEVSASGAAEIITRPDDRPFLQRTFAALKYPNYRLWFMGQLVSLVGTWMQTTAQGFLVYQLTQSPAYLGYVGFAAGLPSWLFTLYGGVIADRFSRRTVMIVTQSTMMVLAFALAALTATGQIQPWHIIVMAFLLGIANAFDAPARQAFVVELVDRQDLTNAIALNSSMFNMGTVVGPAVAGLTYAAFGPEWCFTINGVSFVAVIAALALMKLSPVVRRAAAVSALAELKEGLRYVAHHETIRVLIAIVGLTSLFGLSFITLIPAWAVTVLHGDATTNGLLLSARGIGSLAGALMIASLGRFRFRGKLLTAGMFANAVLLLLFAGVQSLWLSLLVLAGVGWGFMVLLNMCNNLVQSHVSEHLRGRVMSIYTLIFFGLMPVGALFAGAAAERIGEPMTVAVAAIVLLGVAFALFVSVPRLRALE